MFLSSDVKGTTIWIESIMIPFARGRWDLRGGKVDTNKWFSDRWGATSFLKMWQIDPEFATQHSPCSFLNLEQLPPDLPLLILQHQPWAKEGLLVKFCFFTFHVDAAKFVPCNWGATLFRHVELPLHKRPYEYYSKQMSQLPAIKNKCRSKPKVFKKLNAGIKFRAQLIPGRAGK